MGMDWHSSGITTSVMGASGSLDAAKVGDREKIDGFRRLEGFVRTVQSKLEPRADFDAVIKHEHELQKSLF